MTQPTISAERIEEMLAEVETEIDNAIGDAEADQNPQLAIGAVAEFDLNTMREVLTLALMALKMGDRS